MNIHTISVIIGREYSTRVKKKSFLITTFIVPILFAALCIIPSLLMLKTKEKSHRVAVVDRSGIVLPYFKDSESATFTDYSESDPEELKTNLEGMDKDVLVVVSPLDTVRKTVSVQAYSRKPLGVDFGESLSSKATDAVEAYRISTYGIEDLDKIMQEVRTNVRVTEYTLDESGGESLSMSSIYMVISMVLGMIIYMFITLFGSAVMSSVIEEKSSRVVEVLISSVKATELMFGKIVGVALVALTQFFLWIALTAVILVVAMTLVGKDKFADLAGGTSSLDPTQAMTQSLGVDPSMMPAGSTIDLEAIVAAAPSDTTSAQGEASELGAVINTVRNIPFGQIILCFVIYFILGYLLYASVFAAIGSAVENEADSQQLQLPLTIPLMIGFFIVFFAFKDPDSQIVFWGSMIPFTSPIVMLSRIPFGVPAWQIVVSILLLVLTFMLCAWASAKIYKAGILMFGKKSTWKDLWKWLRQK